MISLNLLKRGIPSIATKSLTHRIGIIKNYSVKPRPGSLAAKQYEKKMTEKIINAPEIQEIPEDYDKREMPLIMSRLLTIITVPPGLSLLSAYSNEYFSYGFTNGLNMLFDWLGYTFAATGGVYFGLSVVRYYLGNSKRRDLETNFRYTISAFPSFISMLTLHYIYDLNIFSPTYMIVGLLVSLLWDYRLSSDNYTPKYWFSFKFKYLLAINFFLVLGVISLLTFQEYKVEMNKMLQGYEAMIQKELGLPEVGTPKSNLPQESTPEKQKISDILADPTK